MHSRNLKIVLVVFILAALIGAYFTFRPTTIEPPKTLQRPSAVLVEAKPVTVKHFQDNLISVGTLVANESIVITPEVDGVVASIVFDSGKKVDKGAKLIQLDDRTAKAQLAESQARMELAKAQFDRAKVLAEKKIAPLKQLEEARSQYDISQAQFVIAQDRASKFSLNAPFAGIVGLKDVSPGAYVRPTQELVLLENVDPIKVDFNVGEVYLQQLQVGMPVTIEVDGFPGKVMMGKIEALDAKVDKLSRSIRVRASVDNPDKKLRSGLFATVTLLLKEDKTAIMVPESAVEYRHGEQIVFRVLDDVAVMTPVTLGARRDGLVVIEDGLLSYDVVITAGASKVADGTPVRVSSTEAPPPPQAGGTDAIVDKLKKSAQKPQTPPPASSTPS